MNWRSAARWNGRGSKPGTRPRWDAAARACPLLPSRLDREDLVEPPPMPRLTAERGAEECDRALVGRFGADDAGAQRQHVHVVVLDALVRGICVVADGRADAAHLVRGHAGADARATDEDPAVRLTVLDRLTEALREVRIVVVRVGAVA